MKNRPKATANRVKTATATAVAAAIRAAKALKQKPTPARPASAAKPVAMPQPKWHNRAHPNHAKAAAAPKA